jgi:ABC-2 type transport system permease protein
MLRRIGTKALYDQRRSLVGWAIGLGALVLLSVAFYPSVRADARSFRQLLEQIPPALRAIFLGRVADLASPAGYLDGRLFAFTAPVLFLVYAIGVGSRAVAGEEEDGTLDLLLSLPVTRRRVVLEKMGALVAGLGALTAVLWLSLVALGPPFQVTVGVGGITAACVSLFLLALVHGALALAVGAARGSRGLAVAVPVVVAAAGFLLDSLASLVEALRAVRVLSPFYLYAASRPLERGLDAVHVAALLAATAVLVALGAWRFERRDVGVA